MNLEKYINTKILELEQELKGLKYNQQAISDIQGQIKAYRNILNILNAIDTLKENKLI